MKQDPLKQYLALRSSLLKEKSQLESRLEEINQVLSINGSPSKGSVRRGRPPGKTPGRKPGSRSNKLSLKDAVAAATKDKALSKPEILSAIKKMGYKFKAKNPVNSLNVVLYSKKQFKNSGGKFSPA